MTQTIVSTMTAPPPIMSVPPPAVQHMMASYGANPMQQQQQPQAHMYGQMPISSQAPMSHAPSQGATQQQQFVINSNGHWPHSMAQAVTSQSCQPPHSVHLSHPAGGLHGAPLEYRSGSGGTTYQQIQHPIMTTATTSMGVPVVQQQQQYPQMPPMMKMNHQVPPPPFTTASAGNVMQTGPPPHPQPVPFPMPPHDNQMMRSGQKRKLIEDSGENMPNKGGHG